MRLIAGLPAVLVAASGVVWAAPDGAAAASHAVVISGYAFQPASLTVGVGDTVTWTNSDQAPHDVTTTSAPEAIHGSRMDKGGTFSYTFSTPGTYAYICSFHPDMRATVIVRPAASPPANPSVSPRVTPSPARTRYTTVAAPGRMAMPATRRSKTRHQSVVARPAKASPSASPTTAAPAPVAVAAAPAAASAPERPLRPLLIVAGIVAAVATLSLLLLAARAENPGAPPG